MAARRVEVNVDLLGDRVSGPPLTFKHFTSPAIVHYNS